MKNAPFFSILLPTKNRSHLVGYAILSVLQQDFPDFELIICDNDDDPHATNSVVKGFCDPRIQYIRTGGLDMVSNWNTALNAATGHHIIVLEDKMIFYAGALAAINQLISKSPSGIVVWRWDGIQDEGAVPILVQPHQADDALLNSNDILQKVVTNVTEWWYTLPRGICCTVPRSIIDEIIQKTGRPFYEEASPDFVSAVKILAYIDEYLLSGKIFTLVTTSKASNGYWTSRRKFNDFSYLMGSKKFEPNFEGVYVKSPWIVVNCIIADYLRQQKSLGGKLMRFNVSNRAYFEMLLIELITYSLLEKRVLWERWEISQLFSGGDGVFRNLWYTVNLLSHRFTRRVWRKIKSSMIMVKITKQQPLRNAKTSISESFISEYLAGVIKIQDRGSYG
ncbi:glycosyltransferase family 2 protein [Parathermosynechococcus lividus]